MNAHDHAQITVLKLIEARKAQKISKANMAKLLNIDRRTYAKIEQGNVSLLNLHRMAYILGLRLILIPESYFKP